MANKKFINYKNNKYLFTEDNWKNVQITQGDDAPPSDFKQEKNKNRIREAKLKFEYGLKPASYIIKELKDIGALRAAKINEPFNKDGGYGDEFEIMCMNALYGIFNDIALEKNIVNGNKDGGIDAIFKDEKENKVYIYQIKLKIIEDTALSKMQESINAYINKTLNTIPETSHLAAFLDKNFPDIEDYKKEYLIISENSNLPCNTNPKEVFLKFLANRVLVCPEKKMLKMHLTSSTKEIKTYAMLGDEKIIFSFANADTLICDLENCFGKEEFVDKAFANNVRGYEGDDEIMEETVKEQPQMFCSFNNGVSIIGDCHISKEEDNHFLEINNASIINGQQTIVNLFHMREAHQDISKVYVPVFIKRYGNEKEKSDIAKYNNTQKSVASIDLLSLDSNIRKIQKELLSPRFKSEEYPSFYLNIFSSGEKSCIENAKKIFGPSNIIKLADFVKLFSVIKEPTKMGLWKNNYNEQIKNTYKKGFSTCSLLEARKICNAIMVSKPIIKKDRKKYAIADLPLQYLLYLGIHEDAAVKIIDKTTRTFGKKEARKADIYKKANTYSHLMSQIPDKIKSSLSINVVNS